MAEGKLQLEDWLDDLCVRFIINLPQDDLSSVPRICFQVEEAQWYYEDFIRPLDPGLPSMTLRNFCLRIFAHCPLLSAFSQENHISAFEDFLQYKIRVPVRGAIMLNAALDSVVLVKGWKKSATWSFPRGKINMNEDDLDCAVREVYEETGFDLKDAGLVPGDRNVKHIEINIRDQNLRLYVFKDVPMDTYFEPRTRKEISKIQWWRLSDLPAFRRKGQQSEEPVVSGQKFYNVAPFLVQLRKWVVEQKKQHARQVPSITHLSTGLSQDELLTEEERIPKFEAGGAPSKNAMEDATAALKGLLKIQPPTEGLQVEANNIVCSPVYPTSNDNGAALLALLRPKTNLTDNTNSMQPPAGQFSTHPSIPESTQYQQLPRGQAPTTSPSFFPVSHTPHGLVQQGKNTVGRPDSVTPRPRNYRIPTYPEQHRPMQDVPVSDPDYLPHWNGLVTQHGDRIQHQIQHQVLPPPQPMLFMNDRVHSPAVPQSLYQQPSERNTHLVLPNIVPITMDTNMPTITTKPPHKQTLQHLSNQKLALLGAFQNGPPQVGSSSSSGLSSQRPASGSMPAQAQHHELSADTHGSERVTFPSPFGLPHSLAPAESPLALSSKTKTTNEHQSALLSMFKHQATSHAMSTQLSTATAIHTPNLSAVELSTTGAIDTGETLRKGPPATGSVREMSQQSSDQASLFHGIQSLLRENTSSRDIHNGTKDAPMQTIPAYAERRNATQRQPCEVRSPSKASEPLFQPQILKRPATIAAGQAQHTNTAGLKSPGLAAVSQIPHPVGHVQNLLSLFGKTNGTHPIARTDHAKTPPISTPKLELEPRSRIGSLASGSNDTTSRRGSPISPADKGFLLSYLDAVTKTSLS